MCVSSECLQTLHEGTVAYSIDMLPSLKLLGGESKVNETKFKIRGSELVLGYLSHSLV